MSGHHPARFYKRINVICLLLMLALVGLHGPARGMLEFNVIVHDIQVQPISGQLAHHVEARVSVIDPSGAPIRDLQLNNFTVLEDSTIVPAAFKEGDDEAPIALALVVDTSGSMAGTGIDKSRAAASRFVHRLEETNRVAVVSFNDQVEVVTEFNGPGVAEAALSSLQVKPNGGTCLYDAIFKSLQLVGAQPPGRRALLVLTDGRDELPNGKPCSSTVIDDVVRMATTSVPTPIYLVGVGKQVDENSLGRMALLTGGAYFNAADFSQLDDRFTTLFNQLKSQYVLVYDSKAAPGKHTLTVQMTLGSSKDQDARDFMVSELPPVVRITGADDGQMLTEPITLNAEINGQKEAVAKVEWSINGSVVSTLDKPPFTLDINPKQVSASQLKIAVRALDGQGNALSTAQMALKATLPGLADATTPPQTAAAPTVVATTGAAAHTAAATQPAQPENAGGISWVWLVVGGLLIAAAAAGAAWFFMRRGSKAVPAEPSEGADLTMDGADMLGQASQASVKVLYSDDPSLVDRILPIKVPCTSLGRSAGNELVFPLDQPVSRRHAMIELRAGQYFLTELLSGDGVQKPPTFGTFVNDTRLSGSSVPLFPGAEIRLGSRLRLRFIAPNLVEGGDVAADEKTMDDLRDETLD